MKPEEEDLILYCDFADYGALSKALDDKGNEVKESKLDRISSVHKELADEQVEEVIKMIEKFEDDDDVLQVFHTMDMSE